ncbi:hypothetical protein HPB52_011935 [Rhipicephalus sanguineus]|uniref:Uncharacterized protein n=1 Tax=Rhipicephalus sanguineus TaxID=34632 RepID=A0A9D4T9P3_RHISA|nr:hypothetical protein HPB52_011935 [Rhipicephalus sanguineus]
MERSLDPRRSEPATVHQRTSLRLVVSSPVWSPLRRPIRARSRRKTLKVSRLVRQGKRRRQRCLLVAEVSEEAPSKITLAPGGRRVALPAPARRPLMSAVMTPAAKTDDGAEGRAGCRPDGGSRRPEAAAERG